MKKFLLLFILVAGGLYTINAQTTADTLVTFETTADTTGWLVFANGPDTVANPIMIVENPDTTGVNPTDSALVFTVNENADLWAGMVLNDVFVGDSALAITEEQHVFTMMVYRSTPGRVGFKLEREVTDNSVFEVFAETTVVDEWEILTFDFTDVIGNTYQAIAIFPDFPEEDERTAGAVVYLDNIVFGQDATTSAPLVQQAQVKVYPNPALDRLHVQHPNMTGYTISNSLGQAIERAQFGATGLKIIELGNLRSGIHFITVESNDGMQTTRFIKK